MQNEYGTNKLASIPLSLLLIVSGLFGFVLLVPLGAAHASATPTVTVTPNTATVHTTITITGTGFASDSAVQITSQVSSSSSTSGSVTILWLDQALDECGQVNSGVSDAGVDSLIDTSGPYSGCLVTDATGSFSVSVHIPALPGGTQTLNIQDSATTPNKATASITVTPSIVLCTMGSDSDSNVKCTNNSVTDDVISSGYPLTDVGAFSFLINGFGQQDSVSLSSSVFQSGFSPDCTTTNVGQCRIDETAGSFIVAEAVGGVHSITASGASLSATTSFTILPWVNFYNSLTGGTTFSFVGTAPTSVLIEGHGFAASSTIASNSITIGGVTTTHASVKTSSKGFFGVGAGNQLTVSPISGVPFGPVDVVIAGTTFNYANHNINQGANGPLNIRPSPGHNVPRLGGVLISSTAGTAGHGTAVGLLDSTVHYYGDNVYFFGYGFVNGGPTVTIGSANLGTISDIGALTVNGQNTIQTLDPDLNGAIFVTGESGSLNVPEAQDTYQVSFFQGTTITGPANIVSPSYTATATLYLNQFDTALISGGIIYQPPNTAVGGWCDFPITGNTACENVDSEDVVQAEFFAASSTVTVTVGGNTLASGTTGDNGEFQTNSITQSSLDLAQGTWTATASDGTNSATDSFYVNPIVTGPDFGGHALTTHGPAKAGTYTTLLTTANYGVHGLMPNTAYDVNWGMIGATGVQTVGTFTSTATGGIPVPGVQIQIPAGSVGNHIISLVQNGSDYLLGNSFEETDTSAGPVSIYGDVVFLEEVSINVLPSVVNVGQMVTLSGTGLSGTTTYEVSIDNSQTPLNGQILGTFTTDAGGNIPSSVSVKFPVDPVGNSTRCEITNNYPEEASTYYAHAQTAKQYGEVPGVADGTGIVVLAADLALNSTSVAAGHAVSLTANGLCAQGTYNVVFNYAENSQATGFSGTVVAAFAADTNGAGSTTFSVPATASQGAYTLQLVRLAPTSTQLGVLSVPPTVIVTPQSSGVCNTTGCFTAGTATQSLIGQFQTVVVPFTNNANTAVTGVVYGVVTNPAGQTLYYTTATITPGAGQTQTAYLTLSGLPHGTYTVNYFVTNTGGVAISASNSITVTL